MTTSAAPTDLELLRRFINTRDLEDGTDALDTPERTVAWFADLGWLDRAATATVDDVTQLHALREALRALAAENAGHGSGATPGAVIDEAGRSGPLVVSLAEGEPRLVAAGSGVSGVMGRLLAIFYEATKEGTWARLKACGNDTCQWAYYDHSRNFSRRWCASDACGNLMAARAYRARQREQRAGGPAPEA